MKIEVTPFVLDCTEKEQARKVLEEAAEVFGAWQDYMVECQIDGYTNENDLGVKRGKLNLADEIADVIQVACNLAYRHGIDVAAAMERCTERQRARGRL